jgi:hypothetical protein
LSLWIIGHLAGKIFVVFPNRGGVIVQGTELVVTVTFCFASGGFNVSTENSYFENNGCFGV